MFQKNKVRNRKPNLSSSVRLSSVGRQSGVGRGCSGEVGQGRKEPLQGQHGNITSRRDEAGSELCESGRAARERRGEGEGERGGGPDQGRFVHFPRDLTALNAIGKSFPGHVSCL